MEQIDWSKAPEGSTHWDPIDCNHLRQLSDLSLVWNNKIGWTQHRGQYANDLESISRLVRRPSWSGTGLPPVGTVCEVVSPGYSNDRFNRFVGQVVTVIAHDVIDADPVAVFRVAVNGQADEQDYHALVAKCFRPIRTPEQIAAEQREKAIKEMLATCGTTAVIVQKACEDLFDSGFRKFEIVPE